MSVLDKFQLHGRTALITGWGSGIGRATALAFAEAGADVAGLDIVTSGGQDTAAGVAGHKRRSLHLDCDVSDPEAVAAAFQIFDAHFEQIDILVNCASVGSHTRPADLSFAEWQR